MKKFFTTLLLLCYFIVPAQKIVFQDEYSLKNISIASGYASAGGAYIVEDSISKHKVMMVGAKKEFIFYMFDPKWKLLQKFTKNVDKNSLLSNENFEVARYLLTDKKWSFVLKTVSGYTKETVDFTNQSHTVDGRLIEDIAKNYITEPFTDGKDNYVMYLNNTGSVSFVGFTKELSPKTTRIDFASQLPLAKSKKYTTQDLYNQVKSIDSVTVRSPYFTRHKVHFYTQHDKYAVLIAGDEPVAELSFYDKQSGRKLKSQLYSVEDLVKGIKNFNTAALYWDNKVHVLAAYKSGGVYAVFDAESKKMLFNHVYSENDKTSPFNYGPVLYETLPGTIDLTVTKEKVENISMDKFSTEMFKHSCAITARSWNGNIVISLSNYDQKELAGPTSSLRTGMNTMTSAAWYVSAAAGFIFEAGNTKPSARNITWNDLNQSNAGSAYKKLDKGENSAAEYHHKKAIIMQQLLIENRRYIIYFYDKQLKVEEKTFK